MFLNLALCYLQYICIVGRVDSTGLIFFVFLPSSVSYEQAGLEFYLSADFETTCQFKFSKENKK